MDFFGMMLLLVVTLIRPQDWMPLVFGWPLATVTLVIIIIGFMLGGQREAVGWKAPGSAFALGLVATVFLSSWINMDLSYALDSLDTVTRNVVYFFLAFAVVNSVQRMELFLLWMLAIIAFIAYQTIKVGMGGIGIAGQLPLSEYGEEIRVPWIGLWDGPNVVAVLFLIGIGIAMAFVLKKGTKVKQLFFGSLIFSLMTAIYYTGSRGGVLSLAAIGGTVLWAKKLRTLLVLGIVVVAAFGAVIYHPDRALSSEESSARERTMLWEKGFTDLRYRGPVWGIGYNRFRQHSYHHLVAHSNYVTIFAELGTMGLFFFSALSYFILTRLYAVVRAGPALDDKLNTLSTATLGALVGTYAATLFVVMNYEIFYILLGLGARCAVLASDKMDNAKLEMEPRDYVAVVLVMVGIVSLYYLLGVKRIF